MTSATRSSLGANALDNARSAVDCFVSYAREDLPFVQGLVTRLGEAGLRAWVDVDGLYAGEEFWPEIAKAIDSASVLVFVISPDSAASPYCRKELAWAIDRGKRVVPVCRRDVAPSLLPQEVAGCQWVLARDEDDQTAAGDAVAQAIRADWLWLREHSRLLVRAAEWQARGHDRALTLRGSEIGVARRFLARRPSGDARPTHLHRAFVEASLRARRRRMATVAAAAIGTLVVTWLALRSQIGELNYDGLGKIRAGSPAEAVEPLQRAERLCSRVPLAGDRCSAVAANLTRAFLDQGRYDEALVRLSRVVVDSGGVAPGDALGRGSALLSRAYARVMLAETRPPNGGGGMAEYDLARADLDAASAAFGRLSDPLPGLRVDITRARIELAHGGYEQALAALERVAPFSDEPDVHMLLFVTYHCLGDHASSLEYLEAYIKRLPGRTQDPHWLRNQTYIERLTQRCPSTR
jgi:tetratricopeptide (TPR) repeat protein